jgi:hypothetical protein
MAALAAAVPLLVPRLIPIVGHGVKIVGEGLRLPVADPATTGGQFFWGIDFGASEDLSAFGTIGGPALLLISLAVLVRRRRTDTARVVIAVALPMFVVLLALTSRYNPWLSRFLLVPAALAAPLLAVLARRRLPALAIAIVAVVQLFLVQIYNQQRPLTAGHPAPWNANLEQAIRETYRPDFAEAVVSLGQLRNARCLGAVLRPDDPSFLLFGTELQRRVEFLPSRGTVEAARARGLEAVVVGDFGVTRRAFAAAGWKLRALDSSDRHWVLARAPNRTVPHGCGDAV